MDACDQTPPAQRRENAVRGAIVADPRHEIQANGGFADFWYLDDGDILCDPQLALSLLSCFDSDNSAVGAERNPLKTKIIYITDAATLESKSAAWSVEEVRRFAAVCTADENDELTLGLATGRFSTTEEQLRQKATVVKPIHEKVAVCQDVQTEHVLARQSLGVCRVNHILRVHGEELMSQGASLHAFDTNTR